MRFHQSRFYILQSLDIDIGKREMRCNYLVDKKRVGSLLSKFEKWGLVSEGLELLYKL